MKSQSKVRRDKIKGFELLSKLTQTFVNTRGTDSRRPRDRSATHRNPLGALTVYPREMTAVNGDGAF